MRAKSTTMQNFNKMVGAAEHADTIERKVQRYGPIIIGKEPTPEDHFRYTLLNPKQPNPIFTLMEPEKNPFEESEA